MALTQVQGGMLQGSTNTTTTIQSNGTTAITIDSSQNVGIGSASSGNKFEVAGSGMFSGAVVTNTTGTHISYQSSNSQIGAWGPNSSTNGTLVFYSARSNGSNGLERMRVTSDGGVRIACENFANQPSSTNWGIELNNTGASSVFFGQGTGTETQINFGNRNGIRGSIQTNATNTVYNTTSDYRLKENVEPMTGALAKVAQLKPSVYTWKVNGAVGQGFIAHELQEVVPDCVAGEKDAVDENGEPKYQMVDTSFLVATLTAAIQELKAELDATKAEVAALKAAP